VGDDVFASTVMIHQSDRRAPKLRPNGTGAFLDSAFDWIRRTTLSSSLAA
jgi:hypothetical protein